MTTPATIRIPCDTELLEIARRTLRNPDATESQIDAARETLATSRDWQDIIQMEMLARADSHIGNARAVLRGFKAGAFVPVIDLRTACQVLAKSPRLGDRLDAQDMTERLDRGDELARLRNGRDTSGLAIVLSIAGGFLAVAVALVIGLVWWLA